jgi:hypothetical protein
MEKKLSRWVGVIIFLTSLLLLSTTTLAADRFPPYLDYVGDFTYYDGSGGKPENRWLLTLYNIAITQVTYGDGSYASDSYNPLNEPIVDAYIYIGNLYNDNYPNNLIFGPTQPSGGITGPVSFEIRDDTYTYLIATLDYFEATIDPIFGTRVNPHYNLDNIYDITFNPDGNAPYSRYIEELETAYNNGQPVNLFMDFAFNQGSGDFTDDSLGTISGQIVTTPEPVSSILFVSGGAILALRRYWKRKKQSPS